MAHTQRIFAGRGAGIGNNNRVKSITLLQSCCIYFAVALQSCCSDTANIYAARLQHICSGAATHMQCDCKKYAELCSMIIE